MVFTASPPLSFDEFLEQYPEDGRYELVGGQVMRILATRQHDDVADFIADAFKAENKRYSLNYKVSDRIVLAAPTADGGVQGRNPDVSVVDLEMWRSNRSAYTALKEPIQLAVEVISSNWEDDYIDKLDEYQRMGIHEYWIVEHYLALGSRAYLGNPKQPAVFVYLLGSDGQYQCNRFQGDERIKSRTFPQLELTVAAILEA